MTKEEFEKLHKLWQLLDLALDDYDAVIKLPEVRIDMRDWHRAEKSVAGPICYVCLAGAVMHRTFELQATTDANPVHFSREADARFTAIDYLRRGGIETAYFVLHRTKLPLAITSRINVCQYTTSPSLWRSDMDRLLAYLKQEDI